MVLEWTTCSIFVRLFCHVDKPNSVYYFPVHARRFVQLVPRGIPLRISSPRKYIEFFIFDLLIQESGRGYWLVFCTRVKNVIFFFYNWKINNVSNYIL